MKRSERYLMRARHFFGMGAVTVSASVTAGVWSVRAWMETPVAGLAVCATALAGLAIAVDLLREAMKHRRLAREERRWECERQPLIRL